MVRIDFGLNFETLLLFRDIHKSQWIWIVFIYGRMCRQNQIMYACMFIFIYNIYMFVHYMHVVFYRQGMYICTDIQTLPPEPIMAYISSVVN